MFGAQSLAFAHEQKRQDSICLHVASLFDTSWSIGPKDEIIICTGFHGCVALEFLISSFQNWISNYNQKRQWDSVSLVCIPHWDPTSSKNDSQGKSSLPSGTNVIYFLTESNQTLEHHMTFICIHLWLYSTAVSSHLPLWIIHEESDLLGGVHVSFTYLS